MSDMYFQCTAKKWDEALTRARNVDRSMTGPTGFVAAILGPRPKDPSPFEELVEELKRLERDEQDLAARTAYSPDTESYYKGRAEIANYAVVKLLQAIEESSEVN